MKTCLYCDKKATDRYRVNEFGDMFCGDVCYEKHYKETDIYGSFPPIYR